MRQNIPEDSEILVNDEEDSALVDDGRIVGGWETIGEDGFSKNV
jgi:hypothetical protein